MQKLGGLGRVGQSDVRGLQPARVVPCCVRGGTDGVGLAAPRGASCRPPEFGYSPRRVRGGVAGRTSSIHFPVALLLCGRRGGLLP